MEISSMGPVGLVALGIFLGAMLVWLGFCLVSDNHVKGDLVSKEIAFVPAGILGVAVCFYCIAPYAVKVEPVIFGSVLLAGILLAMMTSFRSWFKKPFSAR